MYIYIYIPELFFTKFANYKFFQYPFVMIIQNENENEMRIDPPANQFANQRCDLGLNFVYRVCTCIYLIFFVYVSICI